MLQHSIALLLYSNLLAAARMADEASFAAVDSDVKVNHAACCALWSFCQAHLVENPARQM